MPKIERRVKRITWVASISSAVAITFLACFSFWGAPILDDFVFFAVIVAVFPPAITSYIDFRWKKAIDAHLPDLFTNVVQGQETGMTLSQALEEASRRDYGPLTTELKKMVIQISWGMSLENALLAMTKRVDTTLVKRTIPMIIEASRSGGHAERVFDPMGKFIQTTLLLDKERRVQTRPYIAIIYVAFSVFLLTIVLLFRSFFVGIEGMQELGAALMSPSEIQQIFFRMTAIQAFFGGMVAGKMGDGTISAGLKHSLAMMLCGYVILRLFL